MRRDYSHRYCNIAINMIIIIIVIVIIMCIIFHRFNITIIANYQGQPSATIQQETRHQSRYKDMEHVGQIKHEYLAEGAHVCTCHTQIWRRMSM